MKPSQLLSRISWHHCKTKLENTPPALLIGNIITSVLRNKRTYLQISLGVLLRVYNTILGYTYEVLYFKKSAAVAAAKQPSVHGISGAESDLVQTVVDNCDADIHSPNGKLSTHSLAMILVQPSGTHDDHDPDTIVSMKWQGDMHMLTHHSWMDVHFVQWCGWCHGQQVEPYRTSSTAFVITFELTWSQVTYTSCLTGL